MDYPTTELSVEVDAERCSERSENGVRCQLIRRHPGQHAAMIGGYPTGRSAYERWGDTSSLAFDGPLPWAPSYPRIESG